MISLSLPGSTAAPALRDCWPDFVRSIDFLPVLAPRGRCAVFGEVSPAQEVGAAIVAELAEDILSLKDRPQSIDEEIGQRFFARREARVLISLPGMGPILGALLPGLRG